jgi:hypothetical protein
MTRLQLLLVGLCAALLSVSAPARADEPTQAELEYRPDRYPPPGTGTSFVLAGSGIALGGYAVAFGSSYLWSEAPIAGDLRLPVVGPFLAVAGAGCGSSEVGCSTITVAVRTVFAIFSGIGQVGGLALVAEGLLLPTSDASSSADSARAMRRDVVATPRFVFSPVATDSGFGLNLLGQF